MGIFKKKSDDPDPLYTEGYKDGYEKGYKQAVVDFSPQVDVPLPSRTLEKFSTEVVADADLIEQHSAEGLIAEGQVVKVVRDLNGSVLGIMPKELRG